MNIGATMNISKVNEAAKIPEAANSGDAGFDLSSTEKVEIAPGETKKIGTGLVFEIPTGYGGFVLPRSGLSVKHSLTVPNSPGLIDSGYRGEVIVALRNDSNKTYTIQKGDRIAQIVFIEVGKFFFAEVEKDLISETERGSGGFGSSGRN
jgi:dUTP pyrophosphatase